MCLAMTRLWPRSDNEIKKHTDRCSQSYNSFNNETYKVQKKKKLFNVS